MFSLPIIQGRFAIGATTFYLPVQKTLSVGSSKLRVKNGLKPALQLDEVAFTAYYPARTESSDGSFQYRKGYQWRDSPVKDASIGYSHFTGVPIWIIWPFVYLIGLFLKIAVYHNAPLLHPPTQLPSPHNSDSSKTCNQSWPLVIFSHGLGGSRTAYSQLCMGLASSGRVVLALEHRDGTGPMCIDSHGKATLYIREKEAIWDDSHNTADALPLRAEQLTFRRHEVYLAFAAFRKFVEGTDEMDLQVMGAGNMDLESWRDAVNCERGIALVGHSFGGTTVFSILSTPPPSPEYSSIPLGHALAFDPWLEPLPLSGPTPHQYSSTINFTTSSPLESTVSQPELLVINSEGFTLWNDHFARLKGAVKEWAPQGNRLLTLVRSRHIFFSDFPLLPIPIPFLPKAGAKTVLQLTVKLTSSFLEGKIEEVFSELGTRKMEVEEVKQGMGWNGKGMRGTTRLVGEVGDIVLH